MIDLTKAKDPARVLKNALEPNINPPGTYILYHQGDYSDQIGTTALGRAAYELFQHARVFLVQKLTQLEPRQYNYYAITRP